MINRTNNTGLTLIICGLLAAGTLAIFWPVTHYPFINLDDPEYITQNAQLLTGFSWGNLAWAFQTGYAANWHPLTWISHLVDVQIFSLNAGGHHLSSLILHALNTVLLFLLVRSMTGAFWRSALVAALFGLHPLHVESVAWAAERKDVLSALFFLLTLLAYVRYSRTTAASQGRRRLIWYGLTLLLFALGLMSKPMLVTVPCLLLLLDYWPLGRIAIQHWSELKISKPQLYALLAEKVPFLLLAAASSVVTFVVQDKGQAVGSVESLAFGPRLANAFLSYLKYLAKTVWPADLAIFYPHPFLRYNIEDPLFTLPAIAAALVLAALSAAVLLRARQQPWLSTGWFWFLGMLVPVIGLVQVGSQGLADRYTYLPLIGLFICFVWAFAELAAVRTWTKPLMAGAGVLAILACAGLTSRQVRFWRDDVALFSHAIAATTNNAQAHFNLASALGREGKYDLAINHLRTALELIPSHPGAHYNLGMAFMAQGKLEEAAADYEAAVRLQPGYYAAHNNLGLVLMNLGRFDAALVDFQACAQLEPGSPMPLCNMGLAYLAEGNTAEAAERFEQALRMQPALVEAMAGLGRALAIQGKWDEAQLRFREALRLAPGDLDLQLNLANTLLEAGRTNEAAACFSEALRADPELPQKTLKAGKACLAQGQLELALARFVIAARLQPENAEVQESLGMIYAQKGRIAEAVTHFEHCLRLRPDAQSWYNLGLAHVMQGHLGKAITNYQQAVSLKPDWAQASNDLAWLLATHPDAAFRKGAEAVRLAQRACELSGGKEARYFGTLDAAYAESGRFADAIATAEKARGLAAAAGQKELTEAAEKRLELYRQGKAYHQ